jgi:hypothetical protein
MVVDYGGPNKFKPIHLLYDETKKKDFYAIPLTYKHKLKSSDYSYFFVNKNKEVFKNDSTQLQHELAAAIRKVTNNVTFKLLDVNKSCLDLLPSEIEPNEVFVDNTEVNDLITGFVQHLTDV